MHPILLILTALALNLAFCTSVYPTRPYVLTAYAQQVIGDNAFFSSDWSFDGPSPGASYVSSTFVYASPNLTGTTLGTQTAACLQTTTALQVYCQATLTFTYGFGSLNVAGVYNENASGSSVNLLAVTGGTGNFQGTSGQVTITETEVDDTTSNYRYDYVLQ